MVIHCACVIVLTIFISNLIWGINAENSGPYEIVLEAIKDCTDKGTGAITVRSSSRTNKNGKVVFTGDLTLPSGITDKMTAKGDASIMIDGQWKPIGLVWQLGFPKGCSSLKSMAPIFFGIFKAAKVENPVCPIAKGTYHFVDYYIPGKIANMNTLRYGKYRARISFSKNNQKIGCLCYIANIVPK